MLRTIGVVSFHALLKRRNLANFKHGCQIQYNLKQLEEWCARLGLSAGLGHLDMVAQAAKVLTLSKSDLVMMKTFSTIGSSSYKALLAPKNFLSPELGALIESNISTVIEWYTAADNGSGSLICCNVVRAHQILTYLSQIPKNNCIPAGLPVLLGLPMFQYSYLTGGHKRCNGIDGVIEDGSIADVCAADPVTGDKIVWDSVEKKNHDTGGGQFGQICGTRDQALQCVEQVDGSSAERVEERGRDGETGNHKWRQMRAKKLKVLVSGG
ncbi:hypothetical protein BC830DRAFT_1076302 [Chytriomyces sp. MP71]|nr:hypothetical protein BC830DRAFT_1076302 [Chytriomyces sp. MP71]